jgi:hypothetical protein
MAFLIITQTPISDQIINGQMSYSYSQFDLSGKRWDSVRNYDLNNRPFSSKNNTNGYDIFRLAQGSQTPISNQLDLQNYTTNKTDFSGIASATWTTPSPTESEFANTVINNKIPSISNQQTTINLTEYFSDNYKQSRLYTNTTFKEVTTQATVISALNRIGSGNNGSAYRLPAITDNVYGQYETLDYDQLQKGRSTGQFQDFRQYKKSGNVRRDGSFTNNANPSAASALLVSLNQEASNTKSTAGAYGFFDRETYFGMGQLGDPAALKKDYTTRTEASTQWRLGSWAPTTDKNAIIEPFRGDRVTVRDFEVGTAKEVYKWKRGVRDSLLQGTEIGKIIDAAEDFVGTSTNTTRDFIKFHFLGPRTAARGQYDIFTFRAALSNLTDSFSPGWKSIDYIGRADKSYLYESFERTIDMSFSVYASSRDELKPMWRKLNYLATYTMPEYDNNYITYRGKYLRVTIGDLFIQQPALISNLFYTLVDNDTTWEINLEQDPTNKQVPMRVTVNMTLRMLTDYLPQYMGQAYSLHDENEGDRASDSNWLSDSKPSTGLLETIEAAAGLVSTTGLFGSNRSSGTIQGG